MKKWRTWLSRTALAALGIAVLGSSAGLSVKASSTSAESAQQNDGTTITVVEFGDWPKEKTVWNVKEGTAEENLNLPAELEVAAVIRTPNTAAQDDSGEGGQEGTSGGTAMRSAAQTAMETGENYLLKRDWVNVPVTWEIDPNNENTTSATFNAVDGASYHYVPVISEVDEQGNQLKKEVTLYQENVPYINVVVGNGISAYSAGDTQDSSSSDPSTGSGGENPGEVTVTSTHGIWIAAEANKAEGILPDSDTDNNFRLTKEGTYTVGGIWSRIYLTEKDKNGNVILDQDGKPVPKLDKDGNIQWVTSTKTPIITVQGPGKYYITLASNVKLDTILNGDQGKPIIKVTGGAEVVITSEGGAVMASSGAGEEIANALDIEAGTAVTISGGTSSLDINGRIYNKGNLAFTKLGGLTINGILSNANEVLVGRFDPASPDFPAGKWNPSVVNIGNGGMVVNLGGSKLTVGDGSQLNVNSTLSTGYVFTNAGTLEVGKNGTVTAVGGFENSGGGKATVEGESSILKTNSALKNNGELTVGKWGTVEVGGALENTNRLTVSGWTLPEPNDHREDGGKLIVHAGTGNDTVENSDSGTFEIGEGGKFKTDKSTLVMNNSGDFRIAERECLDGNFQLNKTGVDPENEETGGTFTLTRIYDKFLKEIPEMSYTGENQYNDVITVCDYEKTVVYCGATFDVERSGWIQDVWTIDDKSVSNQLVNPGTYKVVYVNNGRRNNIAKKEFTMAPASLKISFDGVSHVPADHPDFDDYFGPYDPENTEERDNAIAYEIGSGKNIKIKVNLAVFSKVGGGVDNSLNVVVIGKDTTNKTELQRKSYSVQFDQKGCATLNLDEIPTVSGRPVEPDAYEVQVEYKDGKVTSDEAAKLEGHKETIYVVRGYTTIGLDDYDFAYTYGDEIPNPTNRTAYITNAMGTPTLYCNWYKSDNVEEVEEGVKAGTIQSLGEEFPSKEILEKQIPNWKGEVAGDYVLSVKVEGDDYYTGTTVYQKITVLPKDVTVTVKDSSKVYGTSDENNLIDYEVEGLVGDDELKGTLSRDRDRTNVNEDGTTGDDRWDRVGEYAVRKGTLDENNNPNYTINLNGRTNYKITQKTLMWDRSLLIVAQQDSKYKVYGGLTVDSSLETPDQGRVGITYEKLTVSEDGTTLRVDGPKLINVNEALGVDYTQNYTVPIEKEIHIDDSVYHLEVTEGSIKHLSNAIKDKGKTEVGIQSEMTTAVKKLFAEAYQKDSGNNYRIYDVTVTRDGNPVEDIFQKGGLIVTIPYPDGTSKDDMFAVTHMITSKIAGASDPGTIENFAGQAAAGTPAGTVTAPYTLEKTDDGIVIKVTGLSPVAIAWSASGTNPTNPDDPNNGNNNNNNGNNNNNNNNGTNGGTNGTNNGTNGTNNGTNGTNNGTNGTNNGTNGTNNGTNGTNNNNNSSTTKTGTTSTRTTGVKTGDPAQIAFYSISTLIACLLLILIIFLIRAQIRKKD